MGCRSHKAYLFAGTRYCLKKRFSCDRSLLLSSCTRWSTKGKLTALCHCLPVHLFLKNIYYTVRITRKPVPICFLKAGTPLVGHKQQQQQQQQLYNYCIYCEDSGYTFTLWKLQYWRYWIVKGKVFEKWKFWEWEHQSMRVFLELGSGLTFIHWVVDRLSDFWSI